ncbi:MAG: uncharacterized membrane-anchored nucleotide-diphosphate:sugar transferase [Metallosphaera javensis (ex Sakai et al. 2022)]|nr:MAG: uncharacterized membrane-anchored nucleotide-diphosphate:sugar transferase [Metallosphaera javensis (ex Sakai et al. 2022)]
MLFIDVVIILSAILSSSWILLETFYYTRSGISYPAKGSAGGKASIIVAIKEEDPSTISELVENLSKLNYSDYEVILVSDDSEEKFERLKHIKLPVNFRLVRRDKPHGRKAGALNYGVSLSSGELLVFLDAEARVDPDFLTKVSTHLRQAEAVALRLKVRDLKNKLQVLYSGITEFSMDSLFRGRYLRGLPIFPNGSAFAIKSSTLKRIGGWKEGVVAEDLEIGIRLFLNGVKVGYADDVVVETLAPYNWKDLFHQMKRWAYGSGQLLPYSLSMISKGIKGIEGAMYANQWGIYPVFFIMLLIAGFLSPILSSSPIIWISSMSLFLLSSLVFSLRSRTREYDLRIPALMISAFLSGYFLGLFNAKFSWRVTPKVEREQELWIPLEPNVISYLFLVSGIITLKSYLIQGTILFVISIILLIIP